ncbi:MAG: aldose 1-epimerase family protein [Planctomycetaceae bacterium]|nr:aldose 1-epimerase family protein [Planctomycetaceae bacterium]
MNKAGFTSVVLLSLAAVGAAAEGAEPFRVVLTSSKDGTNRPELKVHSRNATPNCPLEWLVTKRTLHGGRQEGVEVVTIDNGPLQIDVCPTRGMSILQVRSKELILKWDSPVKETVHPQFINLNGRGGLGWLEGFNEFLCRCGLENNGHPGTDRFINNVGEEAEMELTLHGRIANIPAGDVELVVDQAEPFAIRLRGQVNERFLFGPKLELHTELVVLPGKTSFVINDEIRNTGAQDQEFQVLYHANFGTPLLEEGARVIAPVKKITPFNDRAAEGMDEWDVYGKPQAGFVEQVYLLELHGDHDNRTSAVLVNRNSDLAASVSWSLEQLPYLTVWKNTGAIEDGYVTGIEPGTNYPQNRRLEREAGRVPKLAPGAAHRASLTFDLFVGGREVEQAVRTVRRIATANEGLDDPRQVQKIEKR